METVNDDGERLRDGRAVNDYETGGQIQAPGWMGSVPVDWYATGWRCRNCGGGVVPIPTGSYDEAGFMVYANPHTCNPRTARES